MHCVVHVCACVYVPCVRVLCVRVCVCCVCVCVCVYTRVCVVRDIIGSVRYLVSIRETLRGKRVLEVGRVARPRAAV
jgi:hypothetical protein